MREATQRRLLLHAAWHSSTRRLASLVKYATVPLGEGRVVLHRTKSRSLRNRVTVYSRHVESYRDSVQALCVEKSTYLVRMA